MTFEEKEISKFDFEGGISEMRRNGEVIRNPLGIN